MKSKFTLLTTLISPLLFFSSSLMAFNTVGQDTCAVNDVFETAIPIDNILPDAGFVCIEGCNMGATAESFNNVCQIGKFPTVWYLINVDEPSLMNIHVSSDDIDQPAITLYRRLNGGAMISPVTLTKGYLDCMLGSNGVAKAIGTDIMANRDYLVAISSYDSIGGNFSLCINTISNTSICVLDRDITIKARSVGGDFSGPYIPGETVTICLNVNEYTAANNGCQWFQGLVPVFGDGWDPSSFDAKGQPLNATINSIPIGVEENGLYGTSRWDWFEDVDYHFNDLNREVGDFDNNGSLDMCSLLYDLDCPDLLGIRGGCCNPCWGAQIGTILPPGWFAYGINGSCPTEGPPIGKDWGDGNTCGGDMGPWSFCFDLVVRKYDGCMLGNTTSDLSLGFFTFTDGEIGAWTGNESICRMDQPAIVTLPFICAPQTDLGIEFLEEKCSNEVFDYLVEWPGIENWTWSVTPTGAVQPSPREGGNGYIIHDLLINQSTEPIDVIYSFAGFEQGSANTVIKQVRFRIKPELRSSLPGVVYACERDNDSLMITTLPLSFGQAPFQFLWSPGGQTTPSITLFPPFQSSSYHVQIVDSFGCVYQKEVLFKVQPCQLDTIVPDDESNDTPTDADIPIGGGKITIPDFDLISNNSAFANRLKVFPLPTRDLINIEWPNEIHDATTLMVLDPRGDQMYKKELSKMEVDKHHMQLNVGSYTNGVYIVILRTKQSYLTGKMVKM
jgi:hypothetical protein